MRNDKQPLRWACAAALVLCLGSQSLATADDYSHGKWTVRFDDATQQVTLVKDGQNVLSDVSARFKYGQTVHSTAGYGTATVTEESLSDNVGAGKQVTIAYASTGLPNVEQKFYLYDGADYVLTDVALSLPSGGQLESNYICPIYSEAQNLFLPQDGNNRFLTVPYDNDGFITYGSFPLSRTANTSSAATGRFARDSISFEVTAIFNGATQRGMVIGSVTHDTWKSAVRLTGSPLAQGHISKLECFSGVTHPATRDEHSGYLQPHGAVKGTRVRSATMMVGLFDDWRTGLETYGAVNAAITPPHPYEGPAIWGWNSWGGMEKHCNYEGCLSVSDFIKNNIQNKGHFAQDGVIYVGLDSWDNMNWDERKRFVEYCHANGQEAGAYWTPWSDWIGDPSRPLEGNNGYTYAQAQTRVNGQLTGGLDPTAPATLSRVNWYCEKFLQSGFKYLKLDFLNSGSKEADHFYRDDITTGTQAYNYGMNYLRERLGDSVIIDLSIAPVFPYQFADARRISCDAWGEMWHTSYMMNSFSFGWWLDRVYSFNDPDHLVMGDRSEAENISRMTTAVVTGYCILGDNLSTSGSYVGTAISQQKAAKYTTYERINDLIAMRLHFRPAYGHRLFGANNSVDLFYAEASDSYVVVHFNYSAGNKNVELDLATLGIDASQIETSRSVECWTGSAAVIADGKLTYSSPNDRARVFRLYKK
ncbi:MAG: hypothetical protein IKQ89_09145 [Muribaculaceae bacterium]|nr:hypothetical protein [Muribaculaceae bacterium]